MKNNQLSPCSSFVGKVNQFKALIIGGGGIFASKHPPLDAESFAEGLTLPIIVLGVGANR